MKRGKKINAHFGDGCSHSRYSLSFASSAPASSSCFLSFAHHSYRYGYPPSYLSSHTWSHYFRSSVFCSCSYHLSVSDGRAEGYQYTLGGAVVCESSCPPMTHLASVHWVECLSHLAAPCPPVVDHRSCRPCSCAPADSSASPVPHEWPALLPPRTRGVSVRSPAGLWRGVNQILPATQDLPLNAPAAAAAAAGEAHSL